MGQYYVGLDLGQAQDYTALAVVEKFTRVTEMKGGYEVKNDMPVFRPPSERVDRTEYQVRALERFKLGTPYPAQVARVNEIMLRLPGAVLVVDQTGVGRAVFDMFKASGIRPVGVTIHGGDKAIHEGGAWRVPKRDLVGALTVAFQTGALKIAAALPEAGTLITELQNFKVKIDPKTAHDSYEAWREGVHDDLVLAVALAVWYGAKDRPGKRFPVAGFERRW